MPAPDPRGGEGEKCRRFRKYAELDLGEADARGFIHDAHVAGEGDLRPAAQRHTIERRDHRHWQFLERCKCLVFAGELARNDILAHAGEFADVGTGAKGLAPRAHDHDSAHPVVACNASAGGEELVEGHECGEVERRVIEGKHRDAAIAQLVVDE
jgi:hypothetical protein